MICQQGFVVILIVVVFIITISPVSHVERRWEKSKRNKLGF